jgi:hypothetical protein
VEVADGVAVGVLDDLAVLDEGFERREIVEC